MSDANWLETYRGTVYRWEVDQVDHFTVAFYFARFEDATHAVLRALGLDPVAGAAAHQACVTTDGYVRYRRELRVGDVLHIRSGVLEVDEHGLRLAHEVVDSADGTVCTTFEHGIALIDRTTRERRARRDPRRRAEPVR
jgi:acyl-CoA thioesterase FadM